MEQDVAAVAPRPSIKPALIVVGIALVVVLGSIALSFVGGGGGGGEGATSTPAGAVRLQGSPLTGVPAGIDLSAIENEGEPPADIVSSLAVPAGSTLTSHEDADQDIDQFDRSITLSVQASPADVLAFYRVELAHGGWGRIGSASQVDNGLGSEIFYERAGSDGYEWEAVVVVTPVSPSIAPELGGGDQTAPTSRLELSLTQVPDAD